MPFRTRTHHYVRYTRTYVEVVLQHEYINIFAFIYSRTHHHNIHVAVYMLHDTTNSLY